MEAFSKIYKAEFYDRFLSNDVRPDGRSLTLPRPVSISTGSMKTCVGSSVVKMGQTTVVCGIRAEVGLSLRDEIETERVRERRERERRERERREEGEEGVGEERERKGGEVLPIVITAELLPLCCAQYRQGKPPTEASLLCSQLKRVFQSSKVFDPQQLLIDDTELTWFLYIDVYCLAHDGNVIDACVLSITSALKNTLLPSVSVSEDGATVTMKGPFGDPSFSSPLILRSFPISLSFAMIDESLVMDPTREEEGLSVASATIVRLGRREKEKEKEDEKEDEKIGLVSVAGEKSIDVEKMVECMEMSKRYTRKMVTKLFES